MHENTNIAKAVHTAAVIFIEFLRHFIFSLPFPHYFLQKKKEKTRKNKAKFLLKFSTEKTVIVFKKFEVARNKNGFVAYYRNFFKRNSDVLISTEKAEKTKPSVNYKRGNFAALTVKLNVPKVTEHRAVTHAHKLFVFKVGNSCYHKKIPHKYILS
jgi:hypothetical protein